VPKGAFKSEVLLGNEPCYVLCATENSEVFKWDWKEASEEADRLVCVF